MSKPIPTKLRKPNRYAPTYDDRRCEHTVNGQIVRFDVECGTKRSREWYEREVFELLGGCPSRNESRCFIHGTPQTMIIGEDIHTMTCHRCEPHLNRSVMIEGVLVDVCKDSTIEGAIHVN